MSEKFTNGDFETGDLTGWASVETGDGSVSVQSATKHGGDYSVCLENTTEGVAGIKQTVDLTEVATLSFYYNIPHSGLPTLALYIAETYIDHIFAQTSGFELAEIDLTEYSFSGNCEVYFKSEVTPP